MTPAKSTLIVASLASALLPPRLARGLVVTTLALAAGLALWCATADRFAGGLVSEVFPEGPAPQFIMALTPLETGAIHLPGPVPLAPVPGDIVLASGAPDQAPSGTFLTADTLTVLPLAAWRAAAEARRAALPLDDIHPAGLILGALILAVMAPAVLRLTFAAAMAGITAATAVMLWHLNRGLVVLPLPPDSLEPVLIGSALVGLVAGWKAMSLKGGTTARMFGQHAAALLLVVPVSLALAPLWGPPQTLLLGLLLMAAVLRPTLLPAVLALPLVDRALDLPPEALLATAFVIVALRLWRDRRTTAAPGQPPGTTAPFTPRPDARGAFDLTQILDPRKET